MLMLSATDRAIAIASKAGTLEIKEFPSRFGGTFAALRDEFGVIEVADGMTEAEERVSAIMRRVGG